MSQIDTIHKSEFPRCHIHRHYLEHKKRSSNGTCSGTHAYIIEGDFIRNIGTVNVISRRPWKPDYSSEPSR